MRRIFLILCTALSCCSVRAQQGKATLPADAYRFQPVPEIHENAAEATGNAAAPVTTPRAEVSTLGHGSATPDIILDDKHKLLAGDRLTFRILEDRVFEDRENRTIPLQQQQQQQQILTVTDSSELNVPYIGLVNVAGKTCREAASEIRKLLEKDYYYKATVVIGLDQATKVVGHFYIYGNVRTPGGFDLPVNETFTAGKAITRAGGFADFADKKNVKVIRTVDGQKQTFELNMVDIWEKGAIEKDLPLLPDDYIFVPQKLINL